MLDRVVPCPTCWILADYTPATPTRLARSECPRGHVNSLAPCVLTYLLSLLGPAFAA